MMRGTKKASKFKQDYNSERERERENTVDCIMGRRWLIALVDPELQSFLCNVRFQPLIFRSSPEIQEPSLKNGTTNCHVFHFSRLLKLIQD